MKYPGGNGGQSGEQVDYGYGVTGVAKSVTQHLAATPYVQNTTYDAAGRMTQRIFGSNLFQTNYTYFPYTTLNGLGRLQQVTAGVTGNLTSLQDLRYTYDKIGNVLTIQDWKAGAPQTQTFTYDHLDRLLTAGAANGTGGTYSESYAYSAIGNLTSKGGTALTYAAQSSSCPAGALNKPHAVVTFGANTYCYDQNGNMVKRNLGTTTTLTYNHDNQLTATSGGATSTFVYDGDGNRVKGTVGGVTTTYVGGHYEVQGATTRKYYYLGSQRVAMLENSTVYYILGDHLGSTSLIVNSTAGLYGENRYKAFGETRYTSGTIPTTFGFTGQRQESGLGLYFYNSRWYDPALGRFVQADSIVSDYKNPQSLNRYSYTLNNPVKYVDPSGHETCYGTTENIGTGEGDISQADCWAIQATVAAVGATGVDAGGTWSIQDDKTAGDINLGYKILSNGEKKIYDLWLDGKSMYVFKDGGEVHDDNIDNFVSAVGNYYAAKQDYDNAQLRLGLALTSTVVSGAGLVLSLLAISGSFGAASPLAGPTAIVSGLTFVASVGAVALTLKSRGDAVDSIVRERTAAAIAYNALATDGHFSIQIPGPGFVPPYELDQRPPSWP
jgi:RHS repeat-associated protein